jgi:hypothetical protein
MEEIQEGTGTLASDHTKESWVVSYTITHSTEVVTLTRHPVTHTTSVVEVPCGGRLHTGRIHPRNF